MSQISLSKKISMVDANNNFKQSIQASIDKMSKLIQSDAPFSVKFKHGKDRSVVARLTTTVRGKAIIAIGRGESRIGALKNARKALFSNHERNKKRYKQQVIRSLKTDNKTDDFTTNNILKPSFIG